MDVEEPLIEEESPDEDERNAMMVIRQGYQRQGLGQYPALRSLS